jgi:hypothetical protein
MRIPYLFFQDSMFTSEFSNSIPILIAKKMCEKTSIVRAIAQEQIDCNIMDFLRIHDRKRYYRNIFTRFAITSGLISEIKNIFCVRTSEANRQIV